MIQMAHFVAIICHYVSGYMTSKGIKVLGGLLMLIKIFTYIFAHFTLQTDIIFEECRDGMIDSS